MKTLTGFFSAIISPKSYRKYSFFKKISLFACLLVLTGNSYAGQYVVWGTTITVYTQSRSGARASQANQIVSSKGIYNGGEHPWCKNHAYIEFDDKELFASALAASLSKQPVNLIYTDEVTPKLMDGHVAQNGCKVFSIFY